MRKEKARGSPEPTAYMNNYSTGKSRRRIHLETPVDDLAGKKKIHEDWEKAC